MKKRVWGILLTLMLCTAALCVGASAEETSSKWTFDYVREIDRQTHGEDCIAHGVQDGYPDWTWHFKSLDDVQCLMAVRWNSGTYTVTFLKNVGLTETYTFEENRSDVVFDLAGHAIRGCVENGPVLVMDYGYGTDYISIQNGTIENTATGGIALQLCTGKTTLKNVNVTDDTILTCQFVTGANYTATFLGGGSFAKIRGAENDSKGTWSKTLLSMTAHQAFRPPR